MVQHVYERCSSAKGVDRVIVATDDERIVEACHSFNADVEMTSANHVSGTDRVAEVAARHPEFEMILNVQGDELAIEPATVSAVALALREADVQISTAKTLFTELEDPSNPNAVKVVTSSNGDALYFSRSLIPYLRDPDKKVTVNYYRHLGIYGFQNSILLQLTKLTPSSLEQIESLEQLRWMEAGYKLRCVTVESRSIGVDTPEDLEMVAKIVFSK